MKEAFTAINFQAQALYADTVPPGCFREVVHLATVGGDDGRQP